VSVRWSGLYADVTAVTLSSPSTREHHSRSECCSQPVHTIVFNAKTWRIYFIVQHTKLFTISLLATFASVLLYSLHNVIVANTKSFIAFSSDHSSSAPPRLFRLRFSGPLDDVTHSLTYLLTYFLLLAATPTTLLVGFPKYTINNLCDRSRDTFKPIPKIFRPGIVPGSRDDIAC